MKISCIPAKTVREFRELLETDPKEVSFVRNEKDWQKYVSNYKCSYHPLSVLTEEEMAEFSKSIKFGGQGIASLKVDMLQQKLTYVNYAEVLRAFGMDLPLAIDYSGYECSAPATCTRETGSICIGDNC